MENENIVYKLLEFSEGPLLRGGKPMTIGMLKMYSSTVGFSIDTEERESFLNDLIRENFNYYTVEGRYGEELFLSTNGYSRLHAFRELKNSQKSSKEARLYAITAIIISGLLALVSIGLTIYQIHKIQDVKIVNFPETQKVEIVNIRDLQTQKPK